MSGEGASRRDLFRMLGRTVARAAGRRAPLPAAPPPPAGPTRAPVQAEVPVERGRLVVDLGLHPVPPGEGLRLLGAGAAEPILLARVTLDHLAAVSGDCPHCGGPLRFDPARDAAICPRGRAAFRLDGLPSEGPRELRLRSYVCHRAGMRVEVEAKPLGGAGDGPP